VINETRERFIKCIAEKIAADRIVEAFFFPVIRQGPIETGVAVIAATPVPAAIVPTEAPALEIADEPPSDRTEVFTASYRWTRKGVERGKWVVEVTTEAHAPLITVATVVRGVQERAGEALDAERLGGDEIRAILPPPVPGAEALVAAEPVVAPDTASAA
jgi:hypothetical protein